MASILATAGAVSQFRVELRALALTRVGLSESRSRTLRETDVLGLSLLADLVEGGDGLFEGSVCIVLEICFGCKVQ